MKFQEIIIIALLSLIPICSFAQKSDIVYATGSGYSEMSALKDAYRNAVSQKVAMLIESSTIIRNEEVIEDKIIAASGGFIDNMEVVSPAKLNSNGIYTVRIKARVLHDKIITAMQGAGSTKAINIQAVKAKSQVKLSAQEEMANFIIKAFDVYMDTWNFEILNTRISKNDDTSLIVEIRGTLSEKDYINKFYVPLEKKLSSMGIKKTAYNYKEKSPYISMAPNFRENKSSCFYMHLLKPDAVETPFKDYIKNVLDKESYVLRLEVKGENSEVLASKNILLKHAGTNCGFGFSLWENWILLGREHFTGLRSTSDKKGVYYWQEIKAFNINIAEDIDKVKSVSIKVLRMEKLTSTADKWS